MSNGKEGKVLASGSINEELFSTKDLYLSSTLVTLKFFMTGIDYQIEGDKNRPVGYFKFQNSPELVEAKNKYIQGLLQVEPKAFITNMHSLKAEVENMYKNPNMFIGSK